MYLLKLSLFLFPQGLAGFDLVTRLSQLLTRRVKLALQADAFLCPAGDLLLCLSQGSLQSSMTV